VAVLSRDVHPHDERSGGRWTGGLGSCRGTRAGTRSGRGVVGRTGPRVKAPRAGRAKVKGAEDRKSEGQGRRERAKVKGAEDGKSQGQRRRGLEGRRSKAPRTRRAGSSPRTQARQPAVSDGAAESWTQVGRLCLVRQVGRHRRRLESRLCHMVSDHLRRGGLIDRSAHNAPISPPFKSPRAGLCVLGGRSWCPRPEFS
jgi:hypothetical protein